MILINDTEQTQINVHDRGFQYGDGLFETIAIRQGKPLHWPRHMARLARDCARLRIPPVDASLLYAEAMRVCDGVARGVLKIILTRGTGGRGYRPPPPGEAGEPTRVLLTYPYPEYPPTWREDGVAVRICTTRLGLNPALAGMKHLNRLEQVMARQEWNDPNVAEGLMLDPAGYVIEGTMTNIFIVRDGGLLTPDLSNGGVAGIMREIMLETARAMGITTRIAALSLDEVLSAEEVFLCNSLIGVWPVRAVGKTPYTPGALTRAIAARALAEDLK